MFGRCGEGRGELWVPAGVAIDSSGVVSFTIAVSQCSVSLCHSLAGRRVDQESCHILLD